MQHPCYRVAPAAGRRATSGGDETDRLGVAGQRPALPIRRSYRSRAPARPRSRPRTPNGPTPWLSGSAGRWPAGHLGRRRNGPLRRCRPAAGTTDQAKPSVARTSVSTLSASNAEWPDALAVGQRRPLAGEPPRAAAKRTAKAVPASGRHYRSGEAIGCAHQRVHVLGLERRMAGEPPRAAGKQTGKALPAGGRHYRSGEAIGRAHQRVHVLGLERRMARRFGYRVAPAAGRRATSGGGETDR